MMLVLGLGAGGAHAALQYRVIDIGLLEFHSRSSALDVNNRGEVVGFSVDGVPDGETLGFLWRDGVMQALKTPGRDDSSARSINSKGQVGLTGFDRDDAFPPLPFLYDSRSGSLRPIPTPLGVGTVNAINAAGHATGLGEADGPARAYFSDGSSGRFITPEGISSFGNDINNADVVVGSANGRAFRWQGGELTLLTDRFSEARAINNAGQIVGQSLTGGPDGATDRAFLYSDGRFRLLDSGGRGAEAEDINERGWIVGTVADADSNLRAVLWRGGAMRDLNTLLTPESAAAWTLQEASALNDRGWIVGTGRLTAGGDPHAFLAMPVPEPASLALMLAGLGVMGAAAARARARHAPEAT
jgi:probable HAF family extracellular repeat protein